MIKRWMCGTVCALLILLFVLGIWIFINAGLEWITEKSFEQLGNRAFCAVFFCLLEGGFFGLAWPEIRRFIK